MDISGLLAIVVRELKDYIADLRAIPVSDEQCGLKVSKAAAIFGTAVDDTTTCNEAVFAVSVSRSFVKNGAGVYRYNCSEELLNERVKELAKTIDKP